MPRVYVVEMPLIAPPKLLSSSITITSSVRPVSPVDSEHTEETSSSGGSHRRDSADRPKHTTTKRPNLEKESVQGGRREL